MGAEELHQAAEILELKANKLEYSAKMDALTDIYNRGHLEVSLGTEFEMSKKSGWPLTVVMVDLDHFKKVNDTYGHDCGDRALKYAVDLLKACIRDTDSLYRYGGEEFVVILPNTSIEGAQSFAERIMLTFNKNMFEYKQDINISITVSAGIAIQGEDSDFNEWGDLLNAADQCLYEAKQCGRNQYKIYEHKKPITAAVG